MLQILMEKVHNLERLDDIAMCVMHVTGLVNIELHANYALTIGYSLCECKFVLAVHIFALFCCL